MFGPPPGLLQPPVTSDQAADVKTKPRQLPGIRIGPASNSPEVCEHLTHSHLLELVPFG